MRAAYDAKACVRYGALMHELCALGVRLDFMTSEALTRYREYWTSIDFKARLWIRRMLLLMMSSFMSIRKITMGRHSLMADRRGFIFDDFVFVQTELVRRRVEHTQATSDQPVNEKQLYYDAIGDCPNGRVYGLGVTWQ
ncbi:hypothetical protein Scep_001560 [Stephania cephalantha]|uniref:Uncharacterized protein n=1 Tax=Stephania cephalantha TaxID=152367 RepID=A0AAP0LC00_9MAGN